MPGSRIGAIFSRSKYSDGRYVIGANGGRSEPWEDILYKYFMLKFNSYMNKEEVYSPINRPYTQTFGNHHVYVYLFRSNGKKKHTTQADYIETYAFELYSNYRSMGGATSIEDPIDWMVDEMQRIFMRYIAHSIAGINIIDNFGANPIDPPNSPNNPFANVYKRVVTIEIYWSEQFLYPMTEDWEKNHFGARYPAGAFVEEIEDPSGL